MRDLDIIMFFLYDTLMQANKYAIVLKLESSDVLRLHVILMVSLSYQ